MKKLILLTLFCLVGVVGLTHTAAAQAPDLVPDPPTLIGSTYAGNMPRIYSPNVTNVGDGASPSFTTYVQVDYDNDNNPDENYIYIV